MLGVAAFLLELALHGHESAADVPACYVHPPLPPEDLKALGVPYLSVDAEGRATLVQPVLAPSPDAMAGTDSALGFEGSSATDIASFSSPSSSSPLHQYPQAKPLQAELESPAVTTYFFNRWMWTQFPLIALANCACTGADAAAALDRPPSSFSFSSSSSTEPQQPHPQPRPPASPTRPKALPASLVKMATLPLPQLIVRKPTRPREGGLVGLAEEGLLGAAPSVGDKDQVRAQV
jgi:hypothetical protein